jgi:hypothetical protein
VDDSGIEATQRAFCHERNAPFLWTPANSKLGFAIVTDGSRPMNGLRHPPAGETNGWYIWFGEEFSTAPDFFSPLHASHLYARYPDSIRLFGLAPGYRFILDGGYLDVWFDAALLNV